MQLYLYCVGRQTIPQREDALIFNNLHKTVSHSAEMDVNSTKVWETSALCLRRTKEEEKT